MPQPFDYTLDVIDPVAAMQNGMAFGQQQRAGEQAMVMNDQSMDMRDSGEARAQTAFEQQNLLFDQGQQDRAAAQEAARAMQGDLAALSEKIATGDYSAQDFAAVATKYPDLIDEMSKMWEGASAERKAADVSELFKGVSAIKAGRPDLAIQMLEDRAVAAENSGDQMEADIARATAAAIKVDPAAGLTSLGLLLQSVDADAAEAVFGKPQSGADRFKVVGDQLVDLEAEGGPAAVPGLSKTDRGPEWVDLSPEEAAAKGFIFAQRNTKTGKVEGDKPPSSMSIRSTPDGGFEVVQGGVGGGGKPTEGTMAASGYLQRMSKAEEIFTALEAEGTVSLGLTDTPVIGTRAEPYKLTVPEQKLMQAQRDWVRAKLRKESGAVIGEDEMAEEIRTYFPQPGEGPEIVAQKKASRKAAEEQLRLMSGGAAADPGSPEPPPAAATGEKSIDDLVREAEGL